MISVVMPAYNAEPYIRRAIESILNQDIDIPEVIAVDDGSTDGTLEVLRGYADRHENVRVLETAHGGGSRALNVGIAAATSEWVAVMHADDIAAPQRLRRQLAAAEEHPEVVAWGTHAYHIGVDDRVLGLSRFGPRDVDEFWRLWKLGADILVLHPTAMFRREAVMRVGGYDPCFTCAEDFDLFMRLAHEGPIVTLEEPLLRYRLHSGSNTMQRFFVEREAVAYIRARRKSELANVSFSTFQEFQEDRGRRPLLRRMLEGMSNTGLFYYRKAATMYGYNRIFRGTVYLAAAGVLRPRYVARKLWSQLFSPSARQLLETEATDP